MKMCIVLKIVKNNIVEDLLTQYSNDHGGYYLPPLFWWWVLLEQLLLKTNICLLDQ